MNLYVMNIEEAMSLSEHGPNWTGTWDNQWVEVFENGIIILKKNVVE